MFLRDYVQLLEHLIVFLFSLTFTCIFHSVRFLIILNVCWCMSIPKLLLGAFGFTCNLKTASWAGVSGQLISVTVTPWSSSTWHAGPSQSMPYCNDSSYKRREKKFRFTHQTIALKWTNFGSSSFGKELDIGQLHWVKLLLVKYFHMALNAENHEITSNSEYMI